MGGIVSPFNYAALAHQSFTHGPQLDTLTGKAKANIFSLFAETE